jgi:DNA-binding transcriptional MerR regulator
MARTLRLAGADPSVLSFDFLIRWQEKPTSRVAVQMSYAAVAIPEKLFFKIGEVCELLGVQAHVLRYWESEFPTLQPQKNRAGQRVYRKRDVEMALRIKELLYEDQYTIAGAKKRLGNDARTGGRPHAVEAEADGPTQPTLRELAPAQAAALPFSNQSEAGARTAEVGGRTLEERLALRRVASELRELLGLLEEAKGSASKGKA